MTIPLQFPPQVPQWLRAMINQTIGGAYHSLFFLYYLLVDSYDHRITHPYDSVVS